MGQKPSADGELWGARDHRAAGNGPCRWDDRGSFDDRYTGFATVRTISWRTTRADTRRLPRRCDAREIDRISARTDGGGSERRQITNSDSLPTGVVSSNRGDRTWWPNAPAHGRTRTIATRANAVLSPAVMTILCKSPECPIPGGGFVAFTSHPGSLPHDTTTRSRVWYVRANDSVHRATARRWLSPRATVGGGFGGWASQFHLTRFRAPRLDIGGTVRDLATAARPDRNCSGKRYHVLFRPRRSRRTDRPLIAFGRSHHCWRSIPTLRTMSRVRSRHGKTNWSAWASSGGCRRRAGTFVASEVPWFVRLGDPASIPANAPQGEETTARRATGATTDIAAAGRSVPSGGRMEWGAEAPSVVRTQGCLALESESLYEGGQQPPQNAFIVMSRRASHRVPADHEAPPSRVAAAAT